MKVLFLADVSLENAKSGSEQVLKQQATGLSRHGFDVYAITRQNKSPLRITRNVSGIQEGCYGVSTQKIFLSLISLFKYPSKFYEYFRNGSNFDVVVSHQPFTCLSLMLATKLQNCPILYVFHSPSHEEYLLSHENENYLVRMPHIAARRLIEGFCLRKASIIIVLSQYMKKKLTTIHQIPTDRIIVIPGGADPGRFQPPRNRSQLKKELGFPDGKIHLLTIRNLEPRMGLDNLLRCIYLLKNKGIDLHLTVGGEGTETKHLGNLIDEYGLAKMVTMTGFIPSELLPQYYGAADFFILPTRKLEGFGLVTPESMACGTPVLGTPVGGTKEILSGLDPKLLFRNPSPEAMAEGIQRAIGKYYNYETKYMELRILCREYASTNYAWHPHIDRLVAIIDEVGSIRNSPKDVAPKKCLHA